MESIIKDFPLSLESSAHVALLAESVTRAENNRENTHPGRAPIQTSLCITISQGSIQLQGLCHEVQGPTFPDERSAPSSAYLRKKGRTAGNWWKKGDLLCSVALAGGRAVEHPCALPRECCKNTRPSHQAPIAQTSSVLSSPHQPVGRTSRYLSTGAPRILSEHAKSPLLCLQTGSEKLHSRSLITWPFPVKNA